MADAKHMRELRDNIIRHLYENYAHEPGFVAPYSALRIALGVSDEELRQVHTLMINQGLSSGIEHIGSIGLGDRGQVEAEHIGPITSLRAQQSPQQVTINANYSLVQVSGSNSTQTAHLSIDQSRIETLLEEIERAIPTLPVDDAKKDEAKGQLQALRKGLAAKIGDAGLRAIGGALGSILVAAGAPLGQRLMHALNIAFG